MANFDEGPSSIIPTGTGSIQTPYMNSAGCYHGGGHPPCHHYIGQDILSGLRQRGRMSDVRRFFCLFTTFDLLLTSLMWLICLVLAGNFNFYDAFNSQIVHYHIQTSIFDIVMAAAVRFTSLILFYALLHINHWIIVALTTAGTCVFLVAKVYVFNWAASIQPVLQVLLILSSFILSWAEAWFLDLRVIPQEKNSKEYITAVLKSEETSPLLRNYIENSRFDTLSESVCSRFYSPVATPEDSGDEAERPSKRRIRVGADMEHKFRMRAEEIMQSALNYTESENWKQEVVTKQRDIIYSRKDERGRKIFLLIGTVGASKEILFNIFVHDVENLPKWNPSIQTSKILQVIDDHTDITYQVSANNAIIKSRDFVLLRHWKKLQDSLVVASASVQCDCAPQEKSYVRGENGPSLWKLTSSSDDHSKTTVHWLFNTDIKGWLPHTVVESAFTGVMAEYMMHLRKHSLINQK